MAPAGNRRGYTDSSEDAVAREEAQEVVLNDVGVTNAFEIEQTKEDLAAVESQKDANADEVVEEQYVTVTYVGEQDTLPSQYGTFVKGQPVTLPASVAYVLAEATDGTGNAVFEVK